MEGAQLSVLNSYQVLVDVCDECNSLNCACDYDTSVVRYSTSILRVIITIVRAHIVSATSAFRTRMLRVTSNVTSLFVSTWRRIISRLFP